MEMAKMNETGLDLQVDKELMEEVDRKLRTRDALP